jgi:hypothetical protein
MSNLAKSDFSVSNLIFEVRFADFETNVLDMPDDNGEKFVSIVTMNKLYHAQNSHIYR